MKQDPKSAHRQPQEFAVIKIGGNSLADKLPIIAKDLASISKQGFSPLIIHGGGRQIDYELKDKGIEIKKVNGIRVTDKETMEIVQKTLNDLSEHLVRQIKKCGGDAFNANDLKIVKVEKRAPIDGVDLGFVGEITKIERAKLTSLQAAGKIPVLACMGYNNNVAYNINADTMASWFVKEIKPDKFILLTETGGVLDSKGRVITTIEITGNLQPLIEQKVITEGMLLKMQELKELLEHSKSTVVEICSPDNLLDELFVGKGKGTVIKYGKTD